MRARLIAIIAACFMMLFLAPGAHSASGVSTTAPAATGSTSIKGTIKGPDSKPVPKVHITVKQQDKEIGSATTDAKGAWDIPVPKDGTYNVSLDVTTLPSNLQLRRTGGETLDAVVVTPGQTRTVIFPLIYKSEQQQGGQPGVPTANPPSEGSAGANAGPIDPQDQSTPFINRLMQMTVEGIKLGAIIAITSVGLSLVFGTTGLINFAHGELVTIGALAAYFFSTSPFHLPLILATVLAIIIGVLVGGIVERGLWRPMRKRGAGLIQMFIISIGLSLLLRHTILVLFGSRRSQYSQYTVQQAMDIGPITITPRDLVVTGLSVLVLFGVAFMLQRTRIGKATRAVADNKDLAEASGIDVNGVIMIVWMIGGGLAALGGVFYGLTQAVYWDMGFNLLLMMFAGVILGGLGSAYGAMVGSFVVGLVAQLSTLWFPVELQNAWALLALIVVLLVRPQGILGRTERAG